MDEIEKIVSTTEQGASRRPRRLFRMPPTRPARQFWFISCFTSVGVATARTSWKTFAERRGVGNYFTTETDAERAAFQIRVFLLLSMVAARLNGPGFRQLLADGRCEYYAISILRNGQLAIARSAPDMDILAMGTVPFEHSAYAEEALRVLEEQGIVRFQLSKDPSAEEA